MGGGLGLEFFGGGRFGAGFGRGPFGESGLIGVCTFSAATGRITCDPVTFNGITVTRSVAYTTAAGQAQSAFDSTTNSVNARTTVSGTVVGAFGRGHGPHHGFGPDGAAGTTSTTGTVTNDTTTVQHASDRTVTGLAKGSTQRTVNGTSAGTETTVGTDSIGRFTITRVAGDTTTRVVIPVQTAGFAYPTAGTVVRSMRVTLTYAGQSPQTASRREVITYNGSNTATVTITQDGTTTSCTLPLPHRRLSCQ
jgi:hypothetical protein